MEKFLRIEAVMRSLALGFATFVLAVLGLYSVLDFVFEPTVFFWARFGAGAVALLLAWIFWKAAWSIFRYDGIILWDSSLSARRLLCSLAIWSGFVLAVLAVLDTVPGNQLWPLYFGVPCVLVLLGIFLGRARVAEPNP